MARVQVDRLFLVLLLDCSKLEEGWNSKNWSRVIWLWWTIRQDSTLLKDSHLGALLQRGRGHKKLVQRGRGHRYSISTLVPGLRLSLESFVTSFACAFLTGALMRALEVENANERHYITKGNGQSGNQCQRPRDQDHIAVEVDRWWCDYICSRGSNLALSIIYTNLPAPTTAR